MAFLRESSARGIVEPGSAHPKGLLGRALWGRSLLFSRLSDSHAKRVIDDICRRTVGANLLIFHQRHVLLFPFVEAAVRITAMKFGVAVAEGVSPEPDAVAQIGLDLTHHDG